MSTNSIAIKIANSVEEAPDYKKLDGYDGAVLDECVIVRKGTNEGRSTVDLVFRDRNGNHYVAMITGRLIRSIATAIGEEP